jgi:Putative adhesin
MLAFDNIPHRVGYPTITIQIGAAGVSNQNTPYPGQNWSNQYQAEGNGWSHDDQQWQPTFPALTPPPPPPLPQADPYNAGDPYSIYNPSQSNASQGQQWNPYTSYSSQTIADQFIAKPQPPQRRRNPWPWVLLVLFICFILAGTGIGFLWYSLHSLGQTVSTSNLPPGIPADITQTATVNNGPTNVAVGTHPTIVIDDSFGAIHISAGSASDKITAQAVDQNNSPMAGYIPYQKSSDGQTITINIGVELDASAIDLAVPPATDLKLNTNGDDITVVGVTGQMSLTTNGGAITLTQDTINGLSTVNTNGGSINAAQVALSGQVSLKTNTDSITFNGTLGPKGTYRFETNTGAIDITLPLKSSFHLDVSTNTGTANTDFPGLQAPFSSVSSNGEAHMNVGNTPRANITLKTNTGSITLHKGK